MREFGDVRRALAIIRKCIFLYDKNVSKGIISKKITEEMVDEANLLVNKESTINVLKTSHMACKLSVLAVIDYYLSFKNTNKVTPLLLDKLYNLYLKTSDKLEVVDRKLLKSSFYKVVGELDEMNLFNKVKIGTKSEGVLLSIHLSDIVLKDMFVIKKSLEENILD